MALYELETLPAIGMMCPVPPPKSIIFLTIEDSKSKYMLSFCYIYYAEFIELFSGPIPALLVSYVLGNRYRPLIVLLLGNRYRYFKCLI